MITVGESVFDAHRKSIAKVRCNKRCSTAQEMFNSKVGQEKFNNNKVGQPQLPESIRMNDRGGTAGDHGICGHQSRRRGRGRQFSTWAHRDIQEVWNQVESLT